MKNNSRFIQWLTAAIIFVIFMLLAPESAWTQVSWESLGSGQHSFRTQLPSDFYVEVPVKSVANESRVVLFNKRLARNLGLTAPEDFARLQELILENLAQVVDTSGTSDKTLIATRYQDSHSKKEGEAHGDGRGLWSGEITIPLANGRVLYIDVFLKGAGQTPLAWFNHSDEDHKDGLQSLGEAVHSFILSEASLQNQLDVTGDLAVIELPYSKYDKRSQGQMKAALTVRVGNHTRMAHFRYFEDDKQKFRRIADYIMRRDLGLSTKAQIGANEVNEYLMMLASNLAEEAARMYDLNAVHTSPTAGNRTSKGSTIDLGTFIYLDALHANYSYLFKRELLLERTDQFKRNLDYLFDYMKNAAHPHAPNTSRQDEIRNRFDTRFKKTLEELTLLRAGFSEEDLKAISNNQKRDFLNLFTSLSQTLGSQEVDLHGQRIVPAAYDMRSALKESLATLKATKGSADLQPWIDLLMPQRSWATPPNAEVRDHAQKWKQAFLKIIGISNIAKDDLTMQKRIERAREIAANPRLDQSQSFFRKFDIPVIRAIQNGESFEAVEALVEKSVNELIDADIRARTITNSGSRAASTSAPAKAVIRTCEDVFLRVAN